MNTERIKEIQQETAYPESISVQQALLKVWNECEQEKTLSIADVMAMLPSSETIEANGMEGGLRDGELQMFWEGAKWLKSHLQKRLLSKGNAVSPLIDSISSMNKAMKEFLSGIDEELEKDPNNEKIQGAKWAYSIAISQFYNRFNRYCQ